MKMKTRKTNLPGNRALSSMVVLFLVLCTSVLPGTAIASYAGDGPAAPGDDQGLKLNSTQTDVTIMDSQSMKYLLVTVNYKECTLNLIDPDTDKVITRINVGQTPLSVMPCPGTMNAAVLLDNDNDNEIDLETNTPLRKKIVLLNMSTREIYGNIYLDSVKHGSIGKIDSEGSVDRMFWGPEGKYLYVVTDTYLSVINTRTYKVEKCFDITGSRVAADISPDGSKIVMFRKIKGKTYVVDRLNTTTNQIEQSNLLNLDFKAKNVGPLVFSPDGSKAYTFIDDMGCTGWIGIKPNLCIIDTNTLTVEMIKEALPRVHFASRTNRMELVISPDGQKLYMLYSSCMRTKSPYAIILTYNLKTRSYEDTIKSDDREIGAIALSPDGSKIYLANYCNLLTRTKEITVKNALNGEIMGHIKVDAGPMDVKIVKTPGGSDQ